MTRPPLVAQTATSTIIRACGAALIVAILVGSLLAVFALRSKEIEDWRRNLKGMSFVLTEHTAQTVFAAYLVLDSITERVQQAGVRNEADFRSRLSSIDMHEMLRERIKGLPQLDVASVVAANGDNLNFSRSYPVPKINLAERDYFKAHKDNAQLGDFISTAVRNKGNGKWTFYISRRLNDAQGQFMGMVLVGLSVDALTGTYDRVVSSLGDGASITLYRSDLTSLARSPSKDEVIGKINRAGSTHQVIGEQKANDDVVMINTPRFATGLPELRISAVRRVDRYPLVVSLTVPESIFLAGWRRAAALVGASAFISIVFVLIGIFYLNRGAARRERSAHKLHESEVKFHTMVDWATDWEYWIRPEGGVHYMTPSALTFTGYEVAEFERDPGLIDAIVHPADRPLWLDHQLAGRLDLTAPTTRPLDLRIVRKGGAVRWVQHECRPVRGDGGRRHLGWRVTMRDITERKASEDEIRQLAYFDGLTLLPNRRLFLDRLGQALRRSDRTHEVGALLMLDLDHFKRLNDTRGHDVGDRLLVEVAERLKLAVCDGDLVARLGGDEFAVMMESLGVDDDTAAEQAAQRAEQIHAALNNPYALTGDQADHLSSPSIGMTLFRGSTESIEVLLKQADVALYQSKDAGRNVIRRFDPAMQASLDRRMAMEAALRSALVEGQFRLFYQPQVDERGQRTGAEALIRWFDGSGKMISPMDFIPLAEETGLIVELGQWVMDTACVQLKRWQDDPATRHLHMSINVSARQFHQPDFVDRVRQSLAKSGAHPSRLMLELTESIVVDRIDEVIDRMGQLHGVGVNFSLDDFGTGYSSLSYLKQLPLDEVKIDRSFVRDLAKDQNDAAIVRAILAMSDSLGLRVIAEGVETEAQREFLVRNGCHAFQGFLFDRPMPIEQWNKAAVTV